MPHSALGKSVIFLAGYSNGNRFSRVPGRPSQWRRWKKRDRRTKSSGTGTTLDPDNFRFANCFPYTELYAERVERGNLAGSVFGIIDPRV
jgi:hypothetical protein